jgi:DNA mismatch repair ATPase MutS
VLPILRLRSSMRVRASLQAGASYFYAEVVKLKTLVAGADEDSPVLFLCDELLRGTNAHDRTLGARAIVTHLVKRRAMGIVATHDDALCDLCDEPGLSGWNVHFTDVLVNGDMTFDFTLRPGRALDGNALAILAQAGIPVPDSTTVEQHA